MSERPGLPEVHAAGRDPATGRTIYSLSKPVAYLPEYEAMFAPLRDQPVRLLELGVDKGGSLLLWRDYFERGVIVGLDVKSVHIEDASGRIRIYQGRQEDPRILEQIGRHAGPFDCIIDDACHLAAPARASFWYLFERHLKPGGIYVIEDWGTGYWATWPDGHRYKPRPEPGRRSHEHGMVEFVKELIDECGAEDITDPRRGAPPLRAGRFARIQISRGLVFVTKRAQP